MVIIGYLDTSVYQKLARYRTTTGTRGTRTWELTTQSGLSLPLHSVSGSHSLQLNIGYLSTWCGRWKGEHDLW